MQSCNSWVFIWHLNMHTVVQLLYGKQLCKWPFSNKTVGEQIFKGWEPPLACVVNINACWLNNRPGYKQEDIFKMFLFKVFACFACMLLSTIIAMALAEMHKESCKWSGNHQHWSEKLKRYSAPMMEQWGEKLNREMLLSTYFFKLKYQHMCSQAKKEGTF